LAQHGGEGGVAVEEYTGGVADTDGDRGVVEHHPEPEFSGMGRLGHRRLQHLLIPKPGR
jgi:hypothetical protein